MDKLLREERGVTLLELTFACGVLALTLSLLFGSMMRISLANTATEGRAVAVTQVASVMEEFRGTPADEMLSFYPPYFEELGHYEYVELKCFDENGGVWYFPIYEGEDAGGQEYVVPPLPNPLQVECTVRWYDEWWRDHSYTVSEWIYR